jgi:hypothetical protein
MVQRTVIFSGIFWVFCFLLMVFMGDDSAIGNPYYLSNGHYDSWWELFTTAFDLNGGDQLFLYCCDVINYTGESFGYSYADMNLIIFVFFGPLLFLNLLLILLVQNRRIRQLEKENEPN